MKKRIKLTDATAGTVVLGTVYDAWANVAEKHDRVTEFNWGHPWVLQKLELDGVSDDGRPLARVYLTYGLDSEEYDMHIVMDSEILVDE